MEFIKEMIQQLFIWITDLGYWGIMLGLMIEVIPSEIVLSFGGYLVSQGLVSFWGAVLFGTIGGTVAQIFVYWIGRYGGRPFLEKYGKYIFIHQKQIDLSERWFNRYGTGMIFTARFIPVIRHAISIPAGMARMSLLTFTIYTTLAVIPWSIFFIYLGMKLGDSWEHIDEIAAPYVLPFILVSVLLTVSYLVYKLSKGRTKKSGKPEILEMVEKPEKAGKPEKDELVGEQLTARQLRDVDKEYRVLHHRDLRAKGRNLEMAHLVIGPNGVFHISSNHRSGDISFTEQGVTRDKELETADPTAQMYRHEYAIKELLRQHQIKADIVGILCFTHPSSRLIGKSPAFTTVNPDRLIRTIRTYRAKVKLSKEDIDRIEQLCK